MTLATFTAALGALSVTGVKKAYTAPPAQLATANLPALYPRIPASLATTIPVLAGGGVDLRRLTAEIVIVVEPLGQSTAPANFERTVGLIDALHDALAVAAETDESIDGWALRLTAEEVGDNAYWMLVATVNGSE